MVKANNKNANEKLENEQTEALYNKYKSYFHSNINDDKYDKSISREVNNVYNEGVNSYFNVNNSELIEVVNDATIMSLLKNIKSSNAEGFDKISANMVKNSASILYPYVYKLINMIFTFNNFPTDFNTCIIIPIKKNKNIKTFNCDNFRPISISNVFAQIFEAIILSKTDVLNNISSNQFGFRNKLSTVHPLFILNELSKKSKKHQTPLYLGKLDADKAYDSMWRDGLFFKLLKKNMDKRMWCILKRTMIVH